MCATIHPQNVHGVTLKLLNTLLVQELELPTWFAQEDELLTQIFNDTGVLAANAVAQKYGGHQFGQWNPDIGDGRGLLLAEKHTTAGEMVDLHLKGAGKTHYSRFGDGRAVLRSTLREYLAGEALHYLGIPSSRSLCLMSSTHPVQREKTETAALMIRTAPSHIRFGHFEYFFHTQQKDKLQLLFDFTFEHHFRHCLDSENPYEALLLEIVQSTASLIAKCQVFGFCHGVMNTDNMSIHGITFDYGPFGFMDNFHSDHICNHSDTAGRYAYDQQPGVALWNLNALAYSFSDHLTETQISDVLGQYEPTLLREYSQGMAAKFGLQQFEPQDNQLINDYMQHMEAEHLDFTRSFRLLGTMQSAGQNQAIRAHFKDQTRIDDWLQRYAQRLTTQNEGDDTRNQRVNKANPKFILRNYLAQQAIEAAQQGDFSVAEKLLLILQKPYDEQGEFDEFASPPPASAQGIALSCSS